MVNYNGTISEEVSIDITRNRAFLYGDGVFETLKVVDDKVMFLEDHYFRLMASMRILRMEIPMTFTMEYMEQQVLMLADVLNLSNSARVRITFFRKPGGRYLPETIHTDYLITAEPLEYPLYQINEGLYEVDLFKDFYVTKQLLSTLKTINKMVHITGSIYAQENGLQNCLLLNDDKNVVEALQGNVFLLMGNRLITPPLGDGCLNGIMRKQVLSLAGKMESVEVLEESVSPFDLQKADEIFITNVIMGVQPVSRYRKKDFGNNFSADIIKRLNAQIRLV